MFPFLLCYIVFISSCLVLLSLRATEAPVSPGAMLFALVLSTLSGMVLVAIAFSALAGHWSLGAFSGRLTLPFLWLWGALACGLLVWWSGDQRALQNMIPVQSMIAACVWMIVLCGVIRTVLVAGIAFTLLWLLVNAPIIGVRLTGSHLVVKLWLLAQFRKIVGL